MILGKYANKALSFACAMISLACAMISLACSAFVLGACAGFILGYSNLCVMYPALHSTSPPVQWILTQVRLICSTLIYFLCSNSYIVKTIVSDDQYQHGDVILTTSL